MFIGLVLIKEYPDQGVTVAVSPMGVGVVIGTGAVFGFGVQNLVYFGVIAGKPLKDPLPS